MKKTPLLFLALALALAAQALAADGPRYNVLLIMADDLRPAMSCYGDAQAKRPHLGSFCHRRGTGWELSDRLHSSALGRTAVIF